MTRDEMIERAAREMGVSLTGAEALIAVSLMADFASAECDALRERIEAAIEAEPITELTIDRGVQIVREAK